MDSRNERPPKNTGKSKIMTVLPLLLLLISIPLSLVLWLGNMAFSIYWRSESGKYVLVITMNNNKLY